MNKLIKWMMLFCLKATELIDKDQLIKLSFKEKFMLKFHTSMCDACTNYQKQSLFIDKFIKRNFHTFSENDIVVTENKDLKKRIILKIENS